MGEEGTNSESITNSLQEFIKLLTDDQHKKEVNPEYSQIRVFISSTKKDLEEERDAVNNLVERMGFTLATMEKFGARPESPLQTCLSELNDIRIYVCILGMKYGTAYDNKDNTTYYDKSYTEIEYDKVFNKYISDPSSVRILIYCIDEDNAKIHPKFVDTGEDAEKLKKFKDKVKENHTVFFYESTNHLIRRLEFDLENQAQYILHHTKQDKLEKPSDRPYITVETSSVVVYFHQPLRINGVAVNTQTVYLHLQKGDAQSINESDCLPMKKDGTKYIPVNVEKNYTWSYTWDLNDLIGILDSGDYSIIVSSTPDLTDETIVSTTCFIEIKKGFLTGEMNDSTIIPGITSSISGTALTRSPYLYLWFCSSDKLIDNIRLNIEKDDSYNYVFPSNLLKQLSANEQYFCIVQMPVKNELGSVRLITERDENNIVTVDESGIELKRISLGSENIRPGLSSILENLLDESSDLYIKLPCIYEKPIIRNLSINYKPPKVDISGETNLPVGTELFIYVFPISGNNGSIPIVNKKILNRHLFEPIFGRVLVDSNENKKSFSKELRTGLLSKGQYLVSIQLSNGEVIESSLFDAV